MAGCDLAGKHVLVVEDEFFVADDLCRDLRDAGILVIGPVPTVQEALALIEASPALDAAVLDVNLGGKMVFPVAVMLMALSVPFIFTSGYGDVIGDKRFHEAPRLHKPTETRAITDALRSILPGHAATSSDGGPEAA